MKILEHLSAAIEIHHSSRPEAALLHALIAVDATARRLYRGERGVSRRFVSCIRAYYWLVEPMLGGGINLDETTFDNVAFPKVPKRADFAEFVYQVWRCNLAHGEDIPNEFRMLTSVEGRNYFEIGPNLLRPPTTLIWAMAAIAVFSKANKDEEGGGGLYLSLGENRFALCDWWGREDEIRHVAARHNPIRLVLKGLGQWPSAASAG